MEAELGRLADQFLEALCVLHTRHLNENAIGTLAGNVGLASAKLVDPAAHRFDRAGNRLGNLLFDASVVQLNANDPIIDPLDKEVTLVGAGENRGRQWLSQFAQHAQGTLHVGRLAETRLNAIGDNPGTDGADPGITQPLAHVGAQVVEHVLAQLFDVHGVEQMRTAAQIEPE